MSSALSPIVGAHCSGMPLSAGLHKGLKGGGIVVAHVLFDCKVQALQQLVDGAVIEVF